MFVAEVDNNDFIYYEGYKEEQKRVNLGEKEERKGDKSDSKKEMKK